MLTRCCLLPFVICLGLTCFAQTRDEVHPLEPGGLVEREVAGGQTHIYQITLAAGQFMRVGVVPRGVNVALTLIAPDGKQVAAVNFASFAGPESLAWEAAARGDYRLTVRVLGIAAFTGAYQARLEVKPAAAAEDRQQVAIERLLAEANQSNNQGAAAVQQTLERAGQVLVLCRESGDRAGEAFALFLTGHAWYNQTRYEKAAEYYEQAFALFRELKYRGEEGRVLGFLGSSYSWMDQKEKGIDLMEQSLQIRREIKDRIGEGTTLRTLADAYTALSREEKAIEYGEQALGIAREVKDRRIEADSLNSLGRSAYYQGDHERAREYYEQALAIARELKNRATEGGYLLNLGNAYNWLSRLEKAIECFEQSLAVIADPVFAASDERMKTVAMSASQSDAPVASAENTRIIEHLAEDSMPGTRRKLVIPRLPFTRREADQIVNIASGAENLKAVDFKASRAVASGPDLGQYRYIHFATHGLLDSQRPGLSSLVLSLVDQQGRPQDGFLRAHEVYNLNLPAELVVLSACQTGLGKEVKGEGLVGLTRGFMYAGAARVMVSLWSVNDKATSELMAKFYQRMLKEGQRPAAALRSVQVEMWRNSQWRSPYNWAAFVLQGEWK